jgi:diadenosine tetraphosphate (Ap4A) HIT family hydrolase
MNPDTAMRCPFCAVPAPRLVADNAMAIAIRDPFPVNPGHTLVIPRRHVASWFETSPEERLAILELLDDMRTRLDAELRPGGYNIGINAGEPAGQTVMHVHVHLIPRFAGDVDDPAGGVRFVIPERGDYRRRGGIPRTKE